MRDTEVPIDVLRKLPNKVLATHEQTIKNQMKTELGLKNSAAQQEKQQEKLGSEFIKTGLIFALYLKGTVSIYQQHYYTMKKELGMSLRKQSAE